VLIHDDADNCQADACAAAAEAKSAGVTVHVVGLSLKPPDLAKMACVPQITGGRMLNAATADQVGPMLEEAMRLAGGEAVMPEPRQATIQTPTQTQTQTSVQRAPAALSVDGPPGLYMRALLAPKTEPVGWACAGPCTRTASRGGFCTMPRAANPMLPLPPGATWSRRAMAPRGVADGRRRRYGADAGRRAAQRRHAARQGRRAEDGRAADRRRDQHQRRGPGRRRKSPQGAPVAFFKGGEGLGHAAAGRYVVRVEQGWCAPSGGRGAGRQPGPHRDSAERRPRGADGARTRRAGALELPVFSISEDDPDAPKGGARLSARQPGRQSSSCRPAPTT
jgi:hypothetical protein